MKYVCELCGLVYDEEQGLPEKGIAPGTKFRDLPEDFECPGCYSEKEAFDLLPAGHKSPAAKPDPESDLPPELIDPDAKDASER